MTLEPGSGAVERPPNQQPPPDQQPLPGMGRLVAWEHSGPLPPAHELAGYDEVLPGAAERIVRMAELQQQCQIDADKAADERDKILVNAEVTIAKRAQINLTVIVLAFIVLVGYAIWRGQELIGIGAAIAAVATIIYALNGGQFRRNHNNTDTGPAPAEREDGQRS